MRNLKRALSLVLAAAMLIGMMVISASAASKDFGDSAEIKNTEAVDVMVALGVINGKGNGSNFDPTGTLTRAEAAKIVAYMNLGPANAEKLGTTGASFTDVPAKHWAASYIGYCASMDILAGVGNGKFNPEGKLTGIAFGKMLLVALGFDPVAEGYVNDPNWSTNIAVDMVSAGLDVNNIVLSDNISRDDACQMAYNALFYSKTTETKDVYTINGSVTTGTTGIGSVHGTSYDSFSEAYLVATNAKTGAETFTIAKTTQEVKTDSLANKIFKLTRSTTDSDAFLRPATGYASTLKAYKDVADILAPKTADYVVNGKITEKDLYSMVGYKAAGADYTWTNNVDGAASSSHASSKPGKTTATAFADTAPGTVMYVYINDDAKTVTTCLINTYIGEVKKVTAAKDADPRFVTLTNGKTFVTEDFAVKDVVLYTDSKKNVGGSLLGVQSLEIAKSVSGTLTAVTNSNKFTVDGTDYIVSNKGSTALGTANLSKTVSFYVDGQGNIMKDKSAAASATNYILVLANSAVMSNSDYQSGVTQTVEVYGVGTDGVATTLTVSKIGSGLSVSGANDSGIINKLYTYKTDSKGNYELTEVSNAQATADIAVKATSVSVTGGSAILNSDTTFIFLEQADSTSKVASNISVKVGNANIGAAINANDSGSESNVTPAYVAAESGVAKFVFVTRAYADSSTDSGKVVFVDKDTEVATTTSTSKGNETVYSYTAYGVDGKVTVTSKSQIGSDALYKLNDDNSVGATVSTTSGVITAITGNVITIGSTSLNLVDATNEIFTGDDAELKVGQNVSYVTNAISTTDLATIVVIDDQGTVTYTVTGATTTAYELIKGTGVVNTVKLTVDVSGATAGQKIKVTNADASKGDLDASNLTAALTQAEITAGTKTITVTYTAPTSNVTSAVTIVSGT
jgi:hypothetical protein